MIKEPATKAANQTSVGEYLACLFFLLADERFVPLKTQLDINFLMGK